MIFSFVRNTRQAWKVLLGWMTIAVGLTTIYGCLNGWFGMQSDEWFVLLVLAANLANVAAFVWMIRTIRCPVCRSLLFWYALSSKEHSKSLDWFSSFEECPSCGYQPKRGSGAMISGHEKPVVPKEEQPSGESPRTRHG
jgi:hypothetical protein